MATYDEYKAYTNFRAMVTSIIDRKRAIVEDAESCTNVISLIESNEHYSNLDSDIKVSFNAAVAKINSIKE